MKLKLNLTNMKDWGEDRISEFKRPLYEWNNEFDVRIVDIEEKYGNIFRERHLDYVLLDIDTSNESFTLSVFESLRNKLEDLMNIRNAYFEHVVAINLDIECDSELENIIRSWHEKWLSGKYPFRVDIHELDDGCMVLIKPKERITMYQLADLFDYKMPAADLYLE